MATEVLSLDSQTSRDAIARRAGAVLSNGGLVAFPTETVYGVGACTAVAGALERLRELKQRPPVKAFAVHIADPADVAQLVPDPPPLASRLMRKAWPGPLTLVVRGTVGDASPNDAGLNLSAVYVDGFVGLRCPDHPITRDILRMAGSPVVAASANPPGLPPPRTGDEVLQHFDGLVDVLVDAGPTEHAKASTVVRIDGDDYDIIRKGVYTAKTIRRLASKHILFVCTGNTCRSPMAAGIAAALLAERVKCEVCELPDRGILVTSAGIAGGWGSASAHALTAAERRRADIAAHRSSNLTVERIREADLILTMTRAHRNAVLDMVPSAHDRTATLLDGIDVRDPIGGDEQEYEACARTIEEGLRARLQEMSI